MARGFKRTEEGTWVSPMGACFLDAGRASVYANTIEKTYSTSDRETLLRALHALTDIPLPAEVQAALEPWPRRQE